MHAVQDLPAPPTEHVLTAHAAVRMRQRGISAHLIEVVLTYGRQMKPKAWSSASWDARKWRITPPWALIYRRRRVSKCWSDRMAQWSRCIAITTFARSRRRLAAPATRTAPHITDIGARINKEANFE